MKSISNKLYKESDFSFNGNAVIKGTEVGTYNMELKAGDFHNNNKNFTNVEFVIEDGTLVISPVDKVKVTIVENSGTATYDGEEHIVTGYTVKSISNDLYKKEYFSFSGNAEIKGTEAGTYDMELKAGDFHNNNKNFTNVEFEIEDGTLEIAKAKATITAVAASKYVNGKEPKTYDSTAKISNGLSNVATTFANLFNVDWIRPAESFAATTSGFFGDDANKIAYTVSRSDASDNTIGLHAGTVQPKEADDVTGYANKNYDIEWINADFWIYNDELKVTKTVINKKDVYKLGDIIEFNINVKNNGNLTLTNITVTDSLANAIIQPGDGYSVDALTGIATINELKAGAAVDLNAVYVVQETDLGKTDFSNTATAMANPTNPDATEPITDKHTTEVLTLDGKHPNWKVTKTVTNLPSRGYFHSGEVAEFDIKVENTGNQTLNDIVVADLLSGAELKAGSGYTLNANGTATIATLNVGAAVTLKAAYKVTSADATNKKFVNAATATIGTETETGTTGDIPTGTTDNGGNNGGGGNGGGGGGSSSGPRDNGSTPSGGPGATTVTIDPDAVPLANLPNEDGAADLLVIDDEDVPLAALPKTGQSGASGLVLFLSSMMLAAFVAVSKKREDDK